LPHIIQFQTLTDILLRHKELGEHLIESLLTFHAWAAARPRHEHNVVCEVISSKMAKIEETEKDQGRYHTSLCTENHLRLSSVPPHNHRSSETEDEECMYPLVDACPHSPPRPAFVCSRSLGMPMSLLHFTFDPFLSLSQLYRLSTDSCCLSTCSFPEQNRRRLADFVEMMTNAVAGLAENLRSL
jgi:hypothetical protein